MILFAETNCVINEITVEPCPEAANNKPCKLKRGKSAKLSFNFTPGFDATTASSEAYWIGQLNEVPWAGMNTDACAMTTCPIQKGVNQTYSYELEVAKKYPAVSNFF